MYDCDMCRAIECLESAFNVLKDSFEVNLFMCRRLFAEGVKNPHSFFWWVDASLGKVLDLMDYLKMSISDSRQDLIDSLLANDAASNLNANNANNANAASAPVPAAPPAANAAAANAATAAGNEETTTPGSNHLTAKPRTALEQCSLMMRTASGKQQPTAAVAAAAVVAAAVVAADAAPADAARC